MFKQFIWNLSEQRLRGGWRVAVFMVGFVGAFWCLGELWRPIRLLFRDFGPMGGLLEPVFGKASAAMLALAMLALAARFLDRRPLADYGFHFDWRWWRLFIRGVAAGLVIHQVPVLIALLAGGANVAEVFHSPDNSVPFVVGLMVAVPHMLLIGCWEEAILRGFPVRNLMEAFDHLSPRLAPYWGMLALLTSGVVFALFHLFNGLHEMHRLVFLTLWGTCLAAIFSVHGQLAFPIGFHAAADFSVYHGISFDPHAHCFVLLRTPATLPISHQFWYLVLMLAVMLWLAIATGKPGYRSTLGQYGDSPGDANRAEPSATDNAG